MPIGRESLRQILQLAIGTIAAFVFVLTIFLPVPSRTEEAYSRSYSTMPVFYGSRSTAAEMGALSKSGGIRVKRDSYSGTHNVYKVRILKHRDGMVEGIVGRETERYKVMQSTRVESRDAVFIVPEAHLPKALVPYLRRFDLSRSRLFWASYMALVALLIAFVPLYLRLVRDMGRTPTVDEPHETTALEGLLSRREAAMARRGRLSPLTEGPEDAGFIMRSNGLMPKAAVLVILAATAFAVFWYGYLYSTYAPEQLAYIIKNAK